MDFLDSTSTELVPPKSQGLRGGGLSQGQAPLRSAKPLQIQSRTKNRTRRHLSTDQIVAIVLSSIILVGVVMMVLAFAGVFDETGPTVSLTPPLTPTSDSIPVTVQIF